MVSDGSLSRRGRENLGGETFLTAHIETTPMRAGKNACPPLSMTQRQDLEWTEH